MRFRVLISAVIFLCQGFSSTDAGDSIEQGEPIFFSDTMVSAGNKFEFGFIQLQDNAKFYVGIWYKAEKKPSAVWIANRDYPVLRSAIVYLTEEGNLVISDDKMTYMVAQTSAGPGAQARLLDSGNLIVQNGVELFWQSFDNPTNILLPGMSIGSDQRTNSVWGLQSWKTANDPSPGNFYLSIDLLTNLVVYNMTDQYVAGLYPSQYWVGNAFQYLGSNFYVSRNLNGAYITWVFSNSSNISRLYLDSNGRLIRQTWSESSLSWNSSSASQCGAGSCGSNSICNVSSSLDQSPCCCLPGFHPAGNHDSRRGNFTGDCVRRTNFPCDKETEDEITFSKLSDVVPPANQIEQGTEIMTLEVCQSSCRGNCSCTGFSFIVSKKLCLHWTGHLLNMQTASDVDSTTDFNLKLLVSDISPGNHSGAEHDQKDLKNRNKIQVWVISVLTCSLTLFALALLLYYARKRLLRNVGEDLLLFDLNTTPKDDESEFSETYGKEKSTEVKMPLFSFSSVSAATDNFSDENKLGEGGFGPVYKGKTLKGNEIAVKRLSQKSSQGWEELKNEALLIAKLQHKNLVRLLGCCIEGDEKILIYEYMPNKSLDFFLFDPDRRKILDWGLRVRIIEGIAQGMLYLHEYSRFRIVHRDLKVSNILLDAEMNPKIADFGLARLFGGDESEANTNRIVGTFGYMPPEYALEGTYSTKSDVFSFGVLLLEIVSGRKNTGFYSNKDSNLLGHAWDLWTSEKGQNLIDPDLKEASSSPTGLRYVNIALLCVQDSPDDRPSMSSVVSMLGNETIPLSQPNQPGFLNMRSGATSSSKSQVAVDITPVGMQEPR